MFDLLFPLSFSDTFSTYVLWYHLSFPQFLKYKIVPSKCCFALWFQFHPVSYGLKLCSGRCENKQLIISCIVRCYSCSVLFVVIISISTVPHLHVKFCHRYACTGIGYECWMLPTVSDVFRTSWNASPVVKDSVVCIFLSVCKILIFSFSAYSCKIYVY